MTRKLHRQTIKFKIQKDENARNHIASTAIVNAPSQEPNVHLNAHEKIDKTVINSHILISLKYTIL
jgi:hypothetical protein